MGDASNRSDSDDTRTIAGGGQWRTWQLVWAAALALVFGITIGVLSTRRNQNVATVGSPTSFTSPPTSTVATTAPSASTARLSASTTTVLRAPGRTRTNPIALGTEAELLDPLWNVRVLAVTSDAGDIVSRENRFNKPPEDGRQFFMVRVALTYRGPDSDTAISVALESVGASNVVYSDSRDSCGVIPKPIRDGGRVFTGGAVEGNVCWSIRRQDADSLLLLAHRLFGGRDEVYFALH